jgi:putative DNA primase/helicase
MNENKPTMLQAALAIAKKHNWRVFPCNPKDKRPYTKHGFKDATLDPDVITEMWTEHPNAMIGVATGAVSGMFAVDLDRKPGGDDGVATWDAWQRQHGAAATRRHETPSTGQHLLFRYVPKVRSVPLGVLGPGVEIKGDGGYIIVPPSVMEDGRGYTVSGEPQAASSPEWLLQMLRQHYRRRDEARKLDPPTGQQVDVEQVKAALAVIPSESYQTWFEVGGALHRALGKEAGYPLFEEWSKKSKKFRQSECREKWTNGLASVTDFGLGTIFWHANQESSGWRARLVTKSSVIVRASEVPMRAKHWLWKGHLLRGAQELLTGIPGLGKSQVQCCYIACATNRLVWPNGDPAAEPANVIMITAEDTLDQEVVPRLTAANADLSRVHILKYIKTDEKTQRQFLLAEDLDQLAREVTRIGDIGLVTIDPITAYMGGKMDSHKTTEVRSQLGPLKDFAETYDIAVSTVTHPPKNASQRAIDHFIGSQAFIAAGRIGHVCVAEMKEDEDSETMVPTGRILFAHAKHNPSAKMPTLAFRISVLVVGHDEQTGELIDAPYVVWEKESVDITADEAVGMSKKKDSTQGKVQEFLKKILAHGNPVAQKYIVEEGKQRHGFSEKQLRTAKEKIGAVSEKQLDGWAWVLPKGKAAAAGG